MVSETQTVKLFNGGSMEIERNGRHQYRVENGDWKPSVTTMIDHLDAGAFGFGANWTRKLARYAMFPELEELENTRREEHRKQTGDKARKEEIDWIQESRLASEPMITHSYEDLLAYVDTAMNVSKSAREEGTKLHEAIEAYINTREIDESNLAFTSWLKEFSTKTFLATELFCYNPELQYGGTIDGIATNENGELEIWDWKTKENFDSYRSLAKDGAQLGAYASALRKMGSVLAPAYGYVAYIMRDGSGVHVDQVDLAKAEKLFLASRNVYNLLKENK